MDTQTSIWKKEIRLRKRPAADVAPTPASPAPEPKPSIWKRELRLRRAATPPDPFAVELTPPIVEEPEVAAAEVVPFPVALSESQVDPVLRPEPEPELAHAPEPVAETDAPPAAPVPRPLSEVLGWEAEPRVAPEVPSWAVPHHEAWQAPVSPAMEDDAASLSVEPDPYEVESASHELRDPQTPGDTETPGSFAPSSYATTPMYPTTPTDSVPPSREGALDSSANSPSPFEPTFPAAPEAEVYEAPAVESQPDASHDDLWRPAPAPGYSRQSSFGETAPFGPDGVEAEEEAPAEHFEQELAPVPAPEPYRPFESPEPTSPLAWQPSPAPIDNVEEARDPEIVREPEDTTAELPSYLPEPRPEPAPEDLPSAQLEAPSQVSPDPIPVEEWLSALPSLGHAEEASAPDLPLLPETKPETKAKGKASTPAPKTSLLKRELRLPSRKGNAGKQGSRAGAQSGNTRGAKLVGLRVGSSNLTAAHVHNDGSPTLLQVARTALAPGIVAAGEVRDPEALASALKAFFSQHKLPRTGVRLGIAGNRIGVRMLEVPASDDPKLFENSIRFHAQETVPFAIADAVLDYIVLDEVVGTDGDADRMVPVLLVFSHRELVERHVEACRLAGIKLAGVDFEAFALLRSLAPPRDPDDSPGHALVAVAVGHERTIFAVSDGRICDFTRVLDWGGGSLDVAVARALDLTPSQAQPIRLALELDGDATDPDLSRAQIDAARAAIRSELQSLARELVSSLQFYQARPGSLDIGEILFAGGGAQFPGFSDALEEMVGVPVRSGDPLAHIQIGKHVTLPAEPGTLAIAIGLGVDR